MTNIIKCFLIITISCFISCASYISFNNKLKKKLSFTIELTDPHQKIAGDSLGAELTRRLVAFSDENNDFTLVKPIESTDYAFRIRITSFRLISIDSQASVNMALKNITGKYDKKNDSIIENYSSNAGALIAGNIAGNIALNALIPGFGVVLVGQNKSNWATPTEAEQRVIDSLMQFANLGYRAQLFDATGKIKWAKNGIETVKLDNRMSEKEQLFLLVRNIMLDFEGKMPFLKMR